MTTIISLSEIKNLVARQEYALAKQNLESYLQHNHSDIKAIKLYQKVKDKIYAQNLKQVKESMHKLDYLWKQQRYKDLLELYLKIQEYAPNYQPLQAKIQKTYNALLKQESKNNDSKLFKVNSVVQGYISTKNYNEALNFLMDTIKTDPTNPSFQKLLIQTKRQIIDYKIKQNNLKSPNIPQVYDFVKKLYELEPTYFKAQKLLTKVHSKLENYYKIKEKLYTVDAIRQIKVLYNQHNYQKSLQACKDLLRAKPNNKFARKYYLKNLHKIDTENFKTAYKLIVKN